VRNRASSLPGPQRKERAYASEARSKGAIIRKTPGPWRAGNPKDATGSAAGRRGRLPHFLFRSLNGFSSSELPRRPEPPGELVMRQVEEYQFRAEGCRRLAAQMKDPEQKKQVEHMAQGWDLLARARLRHLQNGWDKPPPKE
jgi:hypothetical protein